MMMMMMMTAMMMMLMRIDVERVRSYSGQRAPSLCLLFLPLSLPLSLSVPLLSSLLSSRDGICPTDPLLCPNASIHIKKHIHDGSNFLQQKKKSRSDQRLPLFALVFLFLFVLVGCHFVPLPPVCFLPLFLT